MKTALVTPARAKTPRTPAPTGAGRKAAPPGSGSRPAVDSGQRHRIIADAAYFRAERRGFAGGSELQDWIDAEAEIDGMLRSPGSDD